MVPELREKGLEVIAVKGDRIQVKTEIGYGLGSTSFAALAPPIPAGGGAPRAKEPLSPPAPSRNGDRRSQNAAPAAVAAMGAAMGSGMGAGMGAAMGGNNAPKVLGGAIDSGKVTGILSKHAPTNEGIRAALPELQQAFPGVKIINSPSAWTSCSSAMAPSSTSSWEPAAQPQLGLDARELGCGRQNPLTVV